jgi:hypothetical protein
MVGAVPEAKTEYCTELLAKELAQAEVPIACMVYIPDGRTSDQVNVPPGEEGKVASNTLVLLL